MSLGMKELPFREGPIPLCPNTRHNWIYPVDEKYPERSYQLQMSQTAIMANTLVSLPTGLGKTLIAAVVMYNYYRWFPTGKVVFCAPTRPLVTQQIQACYKIMGIPELHTAEISGRGEASQSLERTCGIPSVSFSVRRIRLSKILRVAGAMPNPSCV